MREKERKREREGGLERLLYPAIAISHMGVETHRG